MSNFDSTPLRFLLKRYLVLVGIFGFVCVFYVICFIPDGEWGVFDLDNFCLYLAEVLHEEKQRR